MKIRTIYTGALLLVLGFLIIAGSARAANNGAVAFEPGETLTYDVNWSVFHAGQVKATLTKQANGSGDAFVVKTTAQSQGFASILYKVEDRFESVFNPDTLCSQRISKRINEGHRHKQTEIVFDSAQRLAILKEKNLSAPSEPLKHAENEIPACVEDIVSAFYYVRSQPMHVGQKIALAVNDGSKTRQVIVTVLDREKIRTPTGVQDALKVQPNVFGNLYLKKKGRMLIWFSDDRHHYPLRIRAMLTVGTITGTLTSVSSGSSTNPTAAEKTESGSAPK